MLTHKMSNSPLHKIWMGINRRCNNPNEPKYKRYGGRGIKVCKRWHKFSNFYKDLIDTYKPGLTLERKNNNRGYTVKNCVWATRKTQANNRSSNRIIVCNGVSKTLTEYSELSGVNRRTIAQRIDNGWKPEDAVFTKARVLTKRI